MPDTPPRAESAFICSLRLLLPAMVFYGCCLVMFAVFRALLCSVFYENIADVDNFLLVFPVGLRMDTVMLCYVLALPVAGLIFFPGKAVRKARFVFSGFLACAAGIFVFLEMATFAYIDEFSVRPDRIFLQNMFSGVEVALMIARGYPVMFATALSVTALTVWLVFTKSSRAFGALPALSPTHRMFTAVIVLPLLFLGMRSSLTHRPVNISDAAFSMHPLVNQLGISSTYSLTYAFYQSTQHEQDPSAVYGKMSGNEIVRRVMSLNNIAPDGKGASDSPLLHYRQSQFDRSRPLNLVIIIEESLGAEYVGCLGGMPLTPHLDRLSREGLLFTNLYSTGTRTVRGIEAVISGFLPTPGKSVVALEKSRQDFFTLAGLLKRFGYDTEFIYGGKSTFDNMKSFFIGNGFTDIHDQDTFIDPVFEGSWGVSDEDLFNKAHEIFSAHGDKPFFALILTTTHHDPFEFPAGRIELYERAERSRYNAIKYTDYALGLFFDKARTAAYYENTVFLVVADHSTRLRGHDLIPIKKFHIPGLIIAPGIKTGTYDRVASQIDLPPTVLDIMGISCAHPMIGRSLANMQAEHPGRAVMQYGDTHAYLLDNHLVVQRPKMRPLQFSVTADRQLVPTDLDPEMQKDALAYALLPGLLYTNKGYGLPALQK
jgi:phosphoglycerol transferase MdoB-like AlkP superfamily enzyme